MDIQAKELMTLLGDIFQHIRRNKQLNVFKDEIRHMTLVHMELLGYLHQKKKAKMSELANFAKVKMPAMTEMISKLVKYGCVKRTHSETDRRSVYVQITKATETQVKKHMEERLRFFNNLLIDFSKEEKDKLIKILKKVKDRIEKE